MADKNDFSEIIAELLIKTDQTNDLLRQVVDRQDRTEQAFNKGFTAMLEKLESIDKQLSRMGDFEERLKRVEAVVFKNGA